MKLTAVVVLITIAVVGLGFKLTATSFLPEEDQGIIFANIQLGDTAGINQTNRTLAEISEQALKMKGIKYFISVAGYSLLGGGGENVALGVVGLDDWAKRKSKSLSIEALTEQLSERFGKTPGAEVNFLHRLRFPVSDKAAACLWNCWLPTAIRRHRNFLQTWNGF